MAAASAGARPFLFGTDLRGPSAEELRAKAEAAEAALAAADRAGYARGFEEGRRAAEAETARRVAEALGTLPSGVQTALAGIEGRIAGLEAEALAFFRFAAERLAGRVIAADPMASVEAAALQAFRHLRGVPHLAVRVAPELVDGTDELLRRMARESGFEGRVIVLGDDETAPGDARLEWADGGVLRDRRAVAAAIEAALAGFDPRAASET